MPSILFGAWQKVKMPNILPRIVAIVHEIGPRERESAERKLVSEIQLEVRKCRTTESERGKVANVGLRELSAALSLSSSLARSLFLFHKRQN